MNSSELQPLLAGIAADRLALLKRHEAGAQSVAHYDFNNTYQYIINREDGHVRWLYDAITDLGGAAEDSAVPDLKPSGKGMDGVRPLIAEDRDGAQRFVEKWQPRIEPLPNARHRTMLRLMLGETLEHHRFFEQILAGRDDLLGRRADGAGTGGGVLPVRWIEQ